MTPTLLKRSAVDAMAMAQTIVKPSTTEMLRYLFRLNATEGTAAKADVIGYRVGGFSGAVAAMSCQTIISFRPLTAWLQ